MKFEFVEWQCIDGFMVPGMVAKLYKRNYVE